MFHSDCGCDEEEDDGGGGGDDGDDDGDGCFAHSQLFIQPSGSSSTPSCTALVGWDRKCITVMMIIIIVIIVIIAFKGAIRDFLEFSHSAGNCLQHTRSSGPGAIVANHVQHIERLSRASVMLRATWYEGTAQLLSLTELKSHLFELYFVG